MKITEVLAEKKICIKKFDFSCDDIDESIPKPLPQSLNWFMLLCGKPGSGKTTLLLNLIAKRGKNYNKKFDRIYLFSPSMGTLKKDPFEDLPDEQKFQELDEDILETVISEITDSGEKVLMIMDDVVNDMKKSGKLQTLLCKLLMNRRHICGSGGSISVIITSQVYNKIPAPVRKTASHLCIYSTKNKRELETIFDELILIPKNDYYELLKYIFQKKNDFMYIDTNKEYNNMFHRNFNQLSFDEKPDISYQTLLDSQGALLGSSAASAGGLSAGGTKDS